MITVESTILALAILTSIALLLLLFNTVRNAIIFNHVHPTEMKDPHVPFVSVLIPARNEEDIIEQCIRSICNQSYSQYEVIVLNDHSTDKTGEILHRLLLEFPQLSIIEGGVLPSHWIGKPHACHQLAMKAKGEYVLFTDADTFHDRSSIESLMKFAVTYNIDMLSAVPKQELKLFWEHVAVPFIHTLYLTYLPHDLILKNPNPQFAAANGQALLFKRESYQLIGGHTSVANSIAEDIDLAIRIKSFGMRLCHASASEIISCRMYRSSRDVFTGFSKNAFATMHFDMYKLLFFVSHLFITYVFPFIGLCIGLLLNNPLIILFNGLSIILSMSLRFIIAMYFGYPLWHSFLHALTASTFIVFAINSALWSKKKNGTEWKGRTYSLSKQAKPIIS
ncbi:MAG: glycosyltransferase [Ignavibacteria bacterium]|nr:glycosyltransferase [Ignavibacteria bacterium]